LGSLLGVDVMSGRYAPSFWFTSFLLQHIVIVIIVAAAAAQDEFMILFCFWMGLFSFGTVLHGTIQ